MTNKATLNFPDINQAFIGATSSYDVCYNYINILNKIGKSYDAQYASKLLEFITIDDEIHFLEDELFEYKRFLEKWSKENGVKVEIKIRKKDFIKFNAKIRLFLLEDRDLNTIRDLLGIRLILCTSRYDTIKTQKLSYQLMNDTLCFFNLKRHCLLLKADGRLGKPLNSNSEIAKKIFIYDKDELLPELKDKVKNYVLWPKDNGYQGLHSYIQTPSGLVFEIQVRTKAMDLYAESIHGNHNLTRYSDSKIDLSPELVQNFPNMVSSDENYDFYQTVETFNSIN